MRLGQTSLIYFIAKVVGSLLGFIATIYFARVLGAEVLGQYALAMAIITWASLAGKVGFSRAITKRVSEGEQEEEFVGAGIVVMCALLLITSLILFLFRGQVDAYVGAPATGFIILILVMILYKSIVNATLQGNHLVHVYAILSTGRQASRALAQILLVAIGMGLSGMLFGYAFGYLVTATIGLWILGLRPARPEKFHIVNLFDYAKYAWLGSFRGRAFNTIDITVLGLFVTQGLIGVYSVAWSLSKFLNIFSDAISSTLFPEMSKVSTEGDFRMVATLTEDALTYAGLILIPGFVGALVLGDLLMLIYGAEFVVGTEVLGILIAGLLIYSYNKQFLNTLNAIDRPDLAFRSNAVFIVANICLNVLLIWQFGWIGAAVATGLSAVFGLVFAFRYTKALVPVSIPLADILYQWVAALSMGLLIYGVRTGLEGHWLTQHNAVFVVILVALGASIYFGTLLVISTTFQKTVKNNLPFDLPLI
ncbi:flippase [Natronosalvus vescus]|uniref:flippase n=1 Tax=Natronosalvus vescus TaxID=2953881 RepID=UPI0020913684|nr:flippase [Natronosalvus vescus]